MMFKTKSYMLKKKFRWVEYSKLKIKNIISLFQSIFLVTLLIHMLKKVCNIQYLSFILEKVIG